MANVDDFRRMRIMRDDNDHRYATLRCDGITDVTLVECISSSESKEQNIQSNKIQRISLERNKLNGNRMVKGKKMWNHRETSEKSNVTLVWCNKIPSKTDTEATEIFLDILLKDYREKLNDKKTKKKDIFRAVYFEMAERGFHVSPNYVEGTEKCYQKWRNLERSFVSFQIRQKLSTGEMRQPPPHFETLSKILSDKHKMSSLSLDDSTEENSLPVPTPDSDNDAASPRVLGEKFVNRSETRSVPPKKKAKRLTVMREVMKGLKEMQDEERQFLEERFLRIENQLQEQTRQLTRLVDIFEKVICNRTSRGANFGSNF